MKTPIRSRLSLSHLLVLFVGMILAGSLTWLAVENLYLTTQRENLLAQARITAAGLDSAQVFPSYPESYSQTTNVNPGIHTRLLSESGAVILGVPQLEGDQPVQLPEDEDPGYVPAYKLILRPEIQSALEGKAETEVRQVESLGGQRVLYAAAPIKNESGEVVSLVYLATPLPDRGLPRILVLQLAGAVLAGALIATLAGMLLAGRIARPLEQLDQAAAMVSRGDLDQQVPVQGGVRELANLGDSFNLMTASLRKSEKAKTNFIADVTHELRTPLTVIRGTVETLEDGGLDDIRSRQGMLASMSRETNRLIQLVNQLLVLTRSDAGALSLQIEPVDLEELARERSALMEALAKHKGVSFNLKAAGPALVMADRSRTAQVLDNLLDNALRYAPAGSSISLSLEDQTDSVRCSVKDSGVGIPADDLPHIFDRFFRVDKARDRESGGAGLGLAIAKSLIEAQGGKLQAFSEIDQGSELAFWLPRADLPAN